MNWGKKGLGLFIRLLLLVIVMSLAAYGITGNMGIEDRFTHAVGLQDGVEEEEGGQMVWALKAACCFTLLCWAFLGLPVTGYTAISACKSNVENNGHRLDKKN